MSDDTRRIENGFVYSSQVNFLEIYYTTAARRIRII